MKSEAKIQNEIILSVNTKYSNRLRLWRNNVGKGYGAWIVQRALKQLASGQIQEALKTLRQARPVTYGVPGSPDLQGFITINGRAIYLGIEVKAEKGTQRKLQLNYEKLIHRAGGFYTVARSSEEALLYIESIINNN